MTLCSDRNECGAGKQIETDSLERQRRMVVAGCEGGGAETPESDRLWECDMVM